MALTMEASDSSLLRPLKFHSPNIFTQHLMSSSVPPSFSNKIFQNSFTLNIDHKYPKVLSIILSTTTTTTHTQTMDLIISNDQRDLIISNDQSQARKEQAKHQWKLIRPPKEKKSWTSYALDLSDSVFTFPS